MLKWIASGCLVIIVVVGIVMYMGYRKLQSVAAEGPSVSVAMHGTPERVFAAMTHSDSLAFWFAPGSTIRASKKGQLAAGDSLFLHTSRDTISSAWVIDTVVSGQILAMRLVVLPRGVSVIRRRDSLSVAGDSTRVTTTVAFMMTDSLANARSRADGASGGMLQMGTTIGMASARMQAEAELKRLKAHIEGTAVSRP